MATDRRPPDNVDPTGAVPQSQTATPPPKSTDDSQAPLLLAPVIFKREKSGKRKKKKKKYTSGTRGLQRLVLGIAQAGFRVSNGMTRGFNTFVKRSRKSSRRRRDGLIRDSLRNAARGFSDAGREASKAPGEIANRISTGRVWRIVRVYSPFRGR